jgi:hypothetical protein
MRWPQACHPPPFLVYQDGGVGPAGKRAHRIRERADLPGIVDIAAEKDKAPRHVVGKEIDFLRRKRMTGNTGYPSFDSHSSPLPQSGSAINRNRVRMRNGLLKRNAARTLVRAAGR